jgi:hypothetical protein
MRLPTVRKGTGANCVMLSVLISPQVNLGASDAGSFGRDTLLEVLRLTSPPLRPIRFVCLPLITFMWAHLCLESIHFFICTQITLKQEAHDELRTQLQQCNFLSAAL